jgi:drug/metabolite transporter (DMT)-like permease
MSDKNKYSLTILSLFAVYTIWSSTYLTIKFAIADIPPMLMAGTRYFIAGLLMYVFLKWRKVPTPTRQEWRNSAIIGIFLLLGGNGFLAWSEQWVGTGVAAINLAIIPVLTCLFSVFLGERRLFREWLGVIIGFSGILILNIGQGSSTFSPGNILLILAPLSWAIGSILTRHLTLPKGLMASAIQMLTGGLITAFFGLLLGEKITHAPSLLGLSSYIYLIIFGSIIGFSAFSYLITNTSPALATSYSFVNPILAVLLGVLFAGEKLNPNILIALSTVVIGVGFVVLGKKSSR